MQRDKPATSWIYRLSKERLLVLLKARKVEVSEQSTADTLRKLLVKAVLGNAVGESSNSGNNLNEDEPESDNESSSDTENTSGGESLNTSIMAESEIKLEFDASEDDWETFTERLELYFIATGITDVEKKKQLCSPKSVQRLIL